MRITVGGNLLKDDQELTVRTADLTTSKAMWNSTISTSGARYMCSDINGFYLETPLPKKEYMRMDMRDIPQAFRDLYGLGAMAKKWIHLHVYTKGNVWTTGRWNTCQQAPKIAPREEGVF